MTQTNLCGFKEEEGYLQKLEVWHEPCNTRAEYEEFSGCRLPTYKCPSCGSRVNANSVIRGRKDWMVIE